MFPARVRAGASSAPAVLALSGCSAGWVCSDTTAERGAAGVRVRVEDVYGQPVGVTAEVVGRRLEPHPQEPSEGDQARFRFRFYGADAGAGRGSDPVVEACAVDEERVVLGCRTISPSQAFRPNGDPTGDDRLSVEHPGRVAAVLVIPNDRSYDRRTCEEDIKDGGGPHPPEPARIGERL